MTPLITEANSAHNFILHPPQINAPALENLPELVNKPANFYSFTLEGLQEFLKKYGKEKFRAQQIFKWVYTERVTNVADMSNLSKSLREEIKGLIDFTLPPVIKHLISVDGTQKFLFDMQNGNSVEAVVIPSDDRLTLCVLSKGSPMPIKTILEIRRPWPSRNKESLTCIN